jgi:hypothetical protein
MEEFGLKGIVLTVRTVRIMYRSIFCLYLYRFKSWVVHNADYADYTD